VKITFFLPYYLRHIDPTDLGDAMTEDSVTPLSDKALAAWITFLTTASETMCTGYPCTTCGAGEFRMAVPRAAAEICVEEGIDFSKGSAVGALVSRTPLDSLYQGYRVMDALRVAACLNLTQKDWQEALTHWLPAIKDNLWATDWVLYRLFPRRDLLGGIGKQWLDECTRVAIETKCGSILESLLIRFPAWSLANPALVAAAQEARHNHQNLGRVLDKRQRAYQAAGEQ